MSRIAAKINAAAGINPANGGEAVFISACRNFDKVLVGRLVSAGDGVGGRHFFAQEVEIVGGPGFVGRDTISFCVK